MSYKKKKEAFCIDDDSKFSFDLAKRIYMCNNNERVLNNFFSKTKNARVLLVSQRPEIIALEKHFNLFTELFYKISKIQTGFKTEDMLTLSELSTHLSNLLNSDETMALIQRAESIQEPLTIKEMALIKEARKIYRRYCDSKSPITKVALNMAQGKLIKSWSENRRLKPFEFFIPYLEKVIRLQIKDLNEKFPESRPYDICLERYISDINSKQLAMLFSILLPKLLKAREIIFKSNSRFVFPFALKRYEINSQIEFINEMLSQIGYNGKYEVRSHAETIRTGPNEASFSCTITRRGLRNSFYSALHEYGHYDYFTNIPLDISNGILGNPPSIMFNEAVALIYGDLIGRSISFWKYWYPRLQVRFPEELSIVSLKDFYIYINSSRELVKSYRFGTWIEHSIKAIIDFEIEAGLFDHTIEVKDIKEKYNEKYRTYLGFPPSNDKTGILQNIQWFRGIFGYSPAYLVAAIYASQLFDFITHKRTELLYNLEMGHFNTLRSYLKEIIYQYGAIYSSKELIKRITGESLNVNSFNKVLEERYLKYL